MTLREWQERLERHFESLAHLREGSGFPVFALEHDLSDEEVEEIGSLLRSYLTKDLPITGYWLPWAIYAAECGYKYDGAEYWVSFGESLPEWTVRNRDELRTCFRKFQRAYDGVSPSGPWASQFNIIAWPVTHAILPRYLQRQFAKLLYELRFHLIRLSAFEPAMVGRLLAANASDTPMRFQQFLEQEELTGRIVLGLLGAAPAEGKEPVYKQTLERIVADLERIRGARAWLRDTRQVVTEFKGIGRGTGRAGEQAFGPYAHRPGAAAMDMGQMGVRPSLVLGHRGGGTWVVRLEIPSFRRVAVLNGEVHSFLRRARCRVNGTPDIKPAGWLLAGNRMSRLTSWPDPHRPLVQLLQSHEAIDHLLESECRLSPGPVWLFKMTQDGNAREVISCVVRPGSEYLVVTTGALPATHPFIRACRVDCTGVEAVRLLIPPSVSAEETAWLARLGLQVARTIRVWPAGLPGRGWDGEGSGEWLTTESPCFGIMHDHPVGTYVFRLNNGAEAEIEAGDPGQPVFVRLAPLPAGIHNLTVAAATPVSELDATGFMELHVREPDPWHPGASSLACLVPTLDPPDPDLDMFWRNEVDLSVVGPAGRTVNCTVSLVDKRGNEILAERVGSPMELPVDPATWKQHFKRFLGGERHSWSYLEAASGFLEIEEEELGCYVFMFEHKVAPLRWVLRRGRGDIVLKLIDESDEEAPLQVRFFSMQRPLVEIRREPDEALRRISASAPGGLLVAQQGMHCAAVVVSAGSKAARRVGGLKSFQELDITPTFLAEAGSADMEGLQHRFRVFGWWANARRYGPLAAVRQKKVVQGLLGEIYASVSGKGWKLAEDSFMKAPRSASSVRKLRNAVDLGGEFSLALWRESSKIKDDEQNMAAMTRWYDDVAQRNNVGASPRLCEFALRLASQPHRLPEVYDRDEVRNLLEQLKNSPTILRGARFLALLSANKEGARPPYMLPDWKW